MRSTRLKIWSAGFYLILSIAVSTRADDLRIMAKTASPQSPEGGWELRYKDSVAGDVISIGGPPTVLRSEILSSPTGAKFLAVTYHSGSAGTQTMTYTDRVAIVNIASPKSRILVDYLSELVREKSPNDRIKFSRSVHWSKDKKTLSVGPLDEEPEGEWTWNGQTFVFKATGHPENDDE